MNAIEVASSPGSLSSPPHSPEQSANNSTINVATPPSGVAAPSPASRSNLTAAGTVRKKPGPKPKPKDPNAPEKKPRQRRKTTEPKDVAVEPAPRKRRGPKASLDAQTSVPPVKHEDIPVHQPPPQPPQQHTPTPQPRPVEVVVPVVPQEPPPITQPPRVLNNAEHIHNNPNLSHINVAPTTPRPASSGQRYDPIRGGIMESKPQSAPPPPPPPPISPPLNRASASPSITSLIDPPTAANSTYTQTVRLQHQSVTSAPVSPAISSRPASVLPFEHQQQLPPQHQPQPPRPSLPSGPTPMEIDSDANSASAVPISVTKTDSTSAGTPSNAPTPPVKPVRQKEAPPPLPTGSGLLSGTPFGPMTSSNDPADKEGTNIWLTFSVKGQENVTINFAQEVEKKYGFAALHPRVAARRERQRQITAAGLALEKAAGIGSADDMSLDMSEPESNVEMGGMDDENSGTNGIKKRRKRKQEEYDKEDDFIDDTELAWEQQALMAKDGFFVYSGPLVTEGEKPAVERADGSTKRGRGRGRGGTARGEAAGRGRGRGGGPGSRGGTTVRKPRVTKADRAQMEQEKHEREKMAANIAAKQPIGTFANGAAV
ncbi:histone promoter control 2 [Amniculicola lignicola CBS 123094]|uniref:Histone promoter control 2 n=1 Tax=Amniculicola lignicola CBS 123094 TaxID=1392246 RepID=A0A6A5WS91_9PLEO|nr:histone promoter control 2 [Amniculicola lignicola CBS 123094]